MYIYKYMCEYLRDLWSMISKRTYRNFTYKISIYTYINISIYIHLHIYIQIKILIDIINITKHTHSLPMLRLTKSYLFSTLKVPIQAIKKLREQTSAPIGQCKTALQQNNLNHEAAIRWLKQKGLSQAEKRLNKQTRQGVIGAMVTTCRSKVALIQVNCQTDFVAKNQLFLNFVYNTLYRSIQQSNTLSYDKQEHKQNIQQFLQKSQSKQLFPQDPSIKSLKQQHKIMISRLQQNIRIRRLITLHSDNKKYGIYVHQGYQPHAGLQAAVAQFTVQPQLDENNQQELEIFGQFVDNIAAQLLGSPAKYLTVESIPVQVMNEEMEKAKNAVADRLTKAPAHTHEKIIQGKLNADFYQDVLLPKMPYLLENSSIPVEQYWKSVEDQLNKKINIHDSFIWICK